MSESCSLPTIGLWLDGLKTQIQKIIKSLKKREKNPPTLLRITWTKRVHSGRYWYMQRWGGDGDIWGRGLFLHMHHCICLFIIKFLRTMVEVFICEMLYYCEPYRSKCILNFHLIEWLCMPMNILSKCLIRNNIF